MNPRSRPVTSATLSLASLSVSIPDTSWFVAPIDRCFTRSSVSSVRRSPSGFIPARVIFDVPLTSNDTSSGQCWCSARSEASVRTAQSASDRDVSRAQSPLAQYRRTIASEGRAQP